MNKTEKEIFEKALNISIACDVAGIKEYSHLMIYVNERLKEVNDSYLLSDDCHIHSLSCKTIENLLDNDTKDLDKVSSKTYDAQHDLFNRLRFHKDLGFRCDILNLYFNKVIPNLNNNCVLNKSNLVSKRANFYLEMSEAIKEENYELAAKINKELNKLPQYYI